MRAGPAGLSGIRYEVLQVTYANGEIEQFPRASDVSLGDRNSATLELSRGKGGGGQEVIATLVLANVRKWEWVTEQPEGSDR